MNTDTNVSSTTPAEDGSSVLTNIENLIKQHLATLERIGKEMKEQRETLEDLFTNDEVYVKHKETAKEANRIKQGTRAQIMKRQDVFAVSEKIKNMRSEKKGLESALSDYLKEYERISGQKTIEDDNGEVREIVYIAKLIKKSAYRP